MKKNVGKGERLYGYQNRKNRKRDQKCISGITRRKPLGKITVRELCSLAAINKSTFYSHYEDIYALSDTMESETIISVLTNISSQQEAPFKDPDVFTRNLYIALVSNHSLINLLFSGTEKSRLGDCLETELKRLINEKFPEYQEDPQRDIMLSFLHSGMFPCISEQSGQGCRNAGPCQRE